ncbi:MAG: hypothetical protein WC788_05060 [Candidatus Paceibacterota bacterium]|jgi:hypothetical protein
MEEGLKQKQDSKIIKIAKIVGELICAIILGHIIYIPSIVISTYVSNEVAYYTTLEPSLSSTSTVLISVLFLILLYLFLTKIIKKKKERLFFILVVTFVVLFDIYMPFGNIIDAYNSKKIFEKYCSKREDGIYTCYMINNNKEIPAAEAYCKSLGLKVTHPHFDYYAFLCYNDSLYNWDDLEEKHLVPYCERGMCVE